MDRNNILKKIVTGDFAGGGLLQPEQAKKFINYVIDESILKNSARFVTMKSSILEIDKIGVGVRVAKAKVEAVAPAPGDFVTIATTKVELVSKEIIVPRKLSWETLEDNIEKAGFEDSLLKMIASQLANDLEELYLDGDTGSVDPYLALMDGWLTLMTVGGHNVVVGAVPLTKTVFSKLKKGLPTKYRRNLTKLRFFCNPDDEQDYRDSLANRDTNLGDASLTGNGTIKVFGTPLVPVPYLPQGTVILTHESNLIVGMRQSGIRLAKDQDIYTGENLYAIHLRTACQIENTDAIAYTTTVISA